MKSTTLSAITLTLFMLLIVLLAAFVFLFQGRTTNETRLESQNESLQGELSRVQQEYLVADATRLAAEATVVAAENESVQLSSQLVALEQEKDGEIASLQADLTLAQESVSQLQSMAPQVTWLEPADDSESLPGRTVDLRLVAGDAFGVDQIVVSVNGEVSDTYLPGGATLVDQEIVFPGDEPGTYVFSAVATNINGSTSQEATVTLTIVEPSPEPTETPEPTATTAATTPASS